MIEELELETYLKISKKNFGIYLFDPKKLINLYEEDIKFENSNEIIDFKQLSNFLDNHIFKIEKLTGKFIKNITLIIENEKTFFMDMGIKKKNYEPKISKIYLENILTEAKDLFKDTNQHQKIIHMLIKNYKIDGMNFSQLSNNINSDHLCLEIKFISISIKITTHIEKMLENYQIQVGKYIDYNYILNFFEGSDIKLSEMAHKIQNGINENEVTVIPKNIKKTGFFEKFFQLFS